MRKILHLSLQKSGHSPFPKQADASQQPLPAASLSCSAPSTSISEDPDPGKGPPGLRQAAGWVALGDFLITSMQMQPRGS